MQQQKIERKKARSQRPHLSSIGKASINILKCGNKLFEIKCSNQYIKMQQKIYLGNEEIITWECSKFFLGIMQQ